MSTLTPNYQFILPGVGDPTDQDLWGGQLNTNTNNLDILLKIATDTVTRSVSSTSSVTTADRNKLILADASGGSLDVDLPAAATAGDGFTVYIKKTDASVNAVTIDPSGAELIDGQASYALSSENDSVMIVCDGTGWFVSAVKEQIDIPVASETVAGIIEIATALEVEAGTDNDRAVTPLGLKSALGYSKTYQSPQVNLVSNAAVTFAHGLGAVPFVFNAYIICTTANNGYSVGDVVSMAQNPFGIATVAADATNINVRFAVNYGLLPKSTGNGVNINLSDWRLFVRAAV